MRLINSKRAVLLLTASRIPISMGFLTVPFILSGPSRLWAWLWLLVIIELTDVMDGHLAREFNATTELGATLDPFADSISRLSIYSAFALNGYVLALVPYVMAVRDITVAYSRIQLVRVKQSPSANWAGKAKAWVQGLAALTIILFAVFGEGASENEALAIVISWIVVVVTALSALPYISSALKKTTVD